MKILDDARKSLNAYAWPGGYPVCYLARDGCRDDETGKLDFNQHDRTESACCATCTANVESWPDLIIVAEYIHYEGPPEYCEWCNGFTDSAYGDPAEETETDSVRKH